MNKKDLLCIIEEIAQDAYFRDFSIKKSDNSIGECAGHHRHLKVAGNA